MAPTSLCESLREARYGTTDVVAIASDPSETMPPPRGRVACCTASRSNSVPKAITLWMICGFGVFVCWLFHCSMPVLGSFPAARALQWMLASVDFGSNFDLRFLGDFADIIGRSCCSASQARLPLLEWPSIFLCVFGRSCHGRSCHVGIEFAKPVRKRRKESTRVARTLVCIHIDKYIISSAMLWYV